MSVRVVRDCVCPRARHRHGTRGAYECDHCRCFHCRLAQHDYYQALTAGDPIPTTRYPDAVGVQRRLQALHAVGWSGRALAARLGMTGRAVHRYREAVNVLGSTHDRIAALYDELWDVEPTGPTVGRVKAWAAAQGFLPPLAWDDDEIDDPTAAPHNPADQPGWNLKPCGTLAAARRHHRRHEPLCGPCRQAGRRREDEAA